MIYFKRTNNISHLSQINALNLINKIAKVNIKKDALLKTEQFEL
jgi:hypothetical protein